jgi:hypothetical protein
MKTLTGTWKDNSEVKMRIAAPDINKHRRLAYIGTSDVEVYSKLREHLLEKCLFPLPTKGGCHNGVHFISEKFRMDGEGIMEIMLFSDRRGVLLLSKPLKMNLEEVKKSVPEMRECNEDPKYGYIPDR